MSLVPILFRPSQALIQDPYALSETDILAIHLSDTNVFVHRYQASFQSIWPRDPRSINVDIAYIFIERNLVFMSHRGFPGGVRWRIHELKQLLRRKECLVTVMNHERL